MGSALLRQFSANEDLIPEKQVANKAANLDPLEESATSLKNDRLRAENPFLNPGRSDNVARWCT